MKTRALKLFMVKCWSCQRRFYVEDAQVGYLVCPHCEYSNFDLSVKKVNAVITEE